MSQPITIPPISTIPAELVGIVGDNLSIPELVLLSRVNKRIRGIVLNILVQRLQLDLPSATPAKELGLTLSVTVLNLRDFFKAYPRKQESDGFVAIHQLLGFTPDLRQRKIPMEQVLPLRSLELLRFGLQQNGSYHDNFAPHGDETRFLLDASEKAIHLGHLRMALELRMSHQNKNYLNYASREAQLEYLCTALRSGNMSLIDYVETMIGTKSLQSLYAKSSTVILSAACTAVSETAVEHVLRNGPSSFVLNADLIALAHERQSPKIFDQILSRRGNTSPAEIFKGLYLFKDLALIEAQRQKLNLQFDPLEFYFACLTMYPYIIQYALDKIGASHSDEAKTKASEYLCRNFDLPLIELLIRKKLFLISQGGLRYSLTKLFEGAAEHNKTVELLNLIDSMDNVDNAYIVSSSIYIKANELKLYSACLSMDLNTAQDALNKIGASHFNGTKGRVFEHLFKNFNLPLIGLLIKNKDFLQGAPEGQTSNLELLFREAQTQDKTTELLDFIDSIENTDKNYIVSSRFYREAQQHRRGFFKSLWVYSKHYVKSATYAVLTSFANFWNFLRNLVR